MGFNIIHKRYILQLKTSISRTSLKIKLFRLLPHLLGTNVLKWLHKGYCFIPISIYHKVLSYIPCKYNNQQQQSWNKASSQTIDMTAYSNSLPSTSLGILGGCLTNILRALQNILLKFVYSWNHTSYMRISSWNFVHVPKAWLWAHIQTFSLKSSL